LAFPRLVSYQFVSYSPHCINDQVTVGMLFSQVGDVYVDGAGLAVEVEASDQVQEPMPADDDSFMLSQGQEEIELLGSQFKGLASHCNLAPLGIYRHLANFDDLLRPGSFLIATQHSSYRGHQFTTIEGLSQVVIGSQL